MRREVFGTDPQDIAEHDLWRRIGLVRYRGAAADLLDLLVTVARSVGWWWLFRDVCVLVDRPARLVVEWVDGQPRPHNAEGRRSSTGDGLTRHAWHGVLVPET